MANNSSVLKNKKIRVRNRYYFKSIRTAIKKLKKEENRNNLDYCFRKTISMIDKLSKRKVLHKKKAGRMKKQLFYIVSKNNEKICN
ncbi:MAG TPA: 30S ribosomal protein S20 [Blattabacteriaceae bacterium]